MIQDTSEVNAFADRTGRTRGGTMSETESPPAAGDTASVSSYIGSVTCDEEAGVPSGDINDPSPSPAAALPSANKNGKRRLRIRWLVGAGALLVMAAGLAVGLSVGLGKSSSSRDEGTAKLAGGTDVDSAEEGDGPRGNTTASASADTSRPDDDPADVATDPSPSSDSTLYERDEMKFHLSYLDPTDKPTPSPSSSPTERPTSNPTEKPASGSVDSASDVLACPDPDDPSYPILQGNAGSVGPFDRCAGDCDENDANCKDGLVCFKRSNNGPDAVPGCRGPVFQDIDYCVRPEDVASHLHQVRVFGEDEKFGRCQGSCDVDNDCAKGLKCFQRQGVTKFEMVPRCCGTGRKGTDYCYDPADDDAGDDPEIENDSPPSEEHPSGDAEEPPSGDPPSNPKCVDLIKVEAGNGKYEKCQGSCDVDDECAGGLMCFQRKGATRLDPVPGCCGAGSAGADYCYDPADEGDDGAGIPEIEDDGPPPEGSPPDDPPSSPACIDLMKLEDGNGKYGKCQGSCDFDDECAGDLQCFQRKGATRLDPIPGCCGTGSAGADYCYDPADSAGGASTPDVEADNSPSEGLFSGDNPGLLFGNEYVTHEELGIKVARGLSVRLIATVNEPVQYADGRESTLNYHPKTDAAGIIPLNRENPTDGGYVYVSNAERGGGLGGVFGIYFDRDGNVVEYKALLTGTTKNCGGGLTPWHTWVSCEEFEDGQCHQVDPNPDSEYHDTPQETKLGGEGGRYESVAVDNRIPKRPVFFVTEDHEMGALRRFVANGSGWESLGMDGETTFLHIIDDSTYEWTSDEDLGRDSANEHFQNTEGISYHEGRLYFMSKTSRKLIVLDLDDMTYETERTGMKFYGEGSFGNEPDQILHGPRRKYIYFCEDGGPNPGVYARHGPSETYFTVFEGFDQRYRGDETIGIAISPGGKRLIAGIQDAGVIFEFTRDDGLPFE